MFKVNLVTRDGASIEFEAEFYDTLLDAAAKSNIFLPAVCREGGCGTCRVTRNAGIVSFGPYSKSALTDAERAAGDILLCRSKAYSDLELSAPFDNAAVGFAPVPERGARIIELAPAGAGAMRLVLQYEDDPPWARRGIHSWAVHGALDSRNVDHPRLLARQHAQLGWNARISDSPASAGRFSSYLRDSAKIGDLLLVKGPQGSFTVDEASQSPRWFVAGGTGVAPMLSMLRQMVEFGVTRRRGCFLASTPKTNFSRPMRSRH